MEFQERIQRIVDLLIRDHAWKAYEHVKRHIDHGIVRRLYMIEHSVRVLADLPLDGSQALPLNQVEKVNVALNALFLNLRGVLDNTAWALAFHFALVENPTEQDRSHQAFAHLFGKQFLTGLAARDQELADRLGTLSEWGRELAAVRDPAAHRIPLYVPPSVVSEAGAERVAEIDEELTAAAEHRDWHGVHALLDQSWNVGRFRRVVALSEQEGLAIVSLPGVLNRDVGRMLDAVELAVSLAFAEGARPLATNCAALPGRRRPV